MITVNETINYIILTLSTVDIWISAATDVSVCVCVCVEGGGDNIRHIDCNFLLIMQDGFKSLDCHKIITQVSHDCHKIITQVSHDCHKIITQVSHDCHKIITQVSHEPSRSLQWKSCIMRCSSGIGSSTEVKIFPCLQVIRSISENSNTQTFLFFLLSMRVISPSWISNRPGIIIRNGWTFAPNPTHSWRCFITS